MLRRCADQGKEMSLQQELALMAGFGQLLVQQGAALPLLFSFSSST
jgi:hypothetical protein